MVCWLGSHMRTHYVARWIESPRSNLRKIASRIAVAVREDTTHRAAEPVPRPLADLTASRTGLRRVRRVDVAHGDPECRSLILDKGLQLAPGPAVQSRSHPFAHPDARADVGQVLQDDRAAAGADGLGNDACADLVVDVSYMPRLPAGDSGQQLLCRLRTVALKSPAKRQEPIARVSECSTSMQGPAAGRSNDVFTEVDTQDVASGRGTRLTHVKCDMKIPHARPNQQLGLFHHAALQVVTLKGAEPHRYVLATARRENRNEMLSQPKRARINVNSGVRTEGDCRPISAVGAMRFKASSNALNCITGHLRTEPWELLSQCVIGQTVELKAVAAAMLERDRRDNVAGRGEQGLQRREFLGLQFRWFQTNRDRALHPNQTTRQVCHTYGTVEARRFFPGRADGLSSGSTVKGERWTA
jgi:hypothetical protein